MFNMGKKKFLQFYPVGSVYETTNSNFDPNKKFGGTWELLKDRFLVGAGGNYANGSYGGSENHTHTISANNTGGTALTVDQMPSHTHGIYASGNWDGNHPGCITLNGNSYYADSANGSLRSNGALSTGGNQQHSHTIPTMYTDTLSNIPPYQAVFMWHRTA